jgi:transaldolase
MEGTGADGAKVLDISAAVGVDLADVFKVLEDEGVEKFIVLVGQRAVTAVRGLRLEAATTDPRPARVR